MKVHFIAIGGAVMHNLAIALKLKGYQVTGSDDEIFDPAHGNLDRYGLLPEKEGWHPERITPDLDAVIVGMHARLGNPELDRATELGLKIYSFPEYIYEQSETGGGSRKPRENHRYIAGDACTEICGRKFRLPGWSPHQGIRHYGAPQRRAGDRYRR